MYAPVIAPITAPNSRLELSLISVILFFIYTEDALLELTNTPMKLEPIARCIGMLNSNVSAGTIIIPPPSPSNEPIIPATKHVERIYKKTIIST